MNNDVTVRDMRDLLNELPDQALEQPFNLVLRLMHKATAINRYDVEICNRDLASWERWRHQQAIHDASVIAQRLGCEAIINGEPLGPAVKLKLPSGRTNDFAQEGWIVPYGE